MPAWSNDSNETFYLGFILSKLCDLKTGMLGKLTYNNKELHFCQHDIIISNKIVDPSCHRFPWWIRAPKRCPGRWGKDSMRPLWDQCSGRFAKIKIWVRYHWGHKYRYRENRWRYITSVGTVSRMLFFLCHGSQRNCCCELEGTVQGYVSMFHSFPYSAYRLWHGQGQTFWPPATQPGPPENSFADVECAKILGVCVGKLSFTLKLRWSQEMDWRSLLQ